MQNLQNAMSHPYFYKWGGLFINSLILSVALFCSVYIIQFFAPALNEVYLTLFAWLLSILSGLLLAVACAGLFPFIWCLFFVAKKEFETHLLPQSETPQSLLPSLSRIELPYPDKIVYSLMNETSDELKARFQRVVDESHRGSYLLLLPFALDEIVLVEGGTTNATPQTREVSGLLGSYTCDPEHIVANESYSDYLIFVEIAKTSFLKNRGALSVQTQKANEVCTWLRRGLTIALLFVCSGLSAGVIEKVQSGVSVEVSQHVPQTGVEVVYTFTDASIVRKGDGQKTVLQLLSASALFNNEIRVGSFQGVQIAGRLHASASQPKQSVQPLPLFGDGVGVGIDSVKISQDVEGFLNEGDKMIVEFKKFLAPLYSVLMFLFNIFGTLAVIYMIGCIYVAVVTKRNGNLGPIMLRLQRAASAQTAIVLMICSLTIGIMVVLNLYKNNYKPVSIILIVGTYAALATAISNFIIPNGKETHFDDSGHSGGGPYQKRLNS